MSPRPAAQAPAAIQVVHALPGRLRLRLPAGTDVAACGAALVGVDGICTVRTSRHARSLTITFDPGRLSAQAAAAAAGQAAAQAAKPQPASAAPRSAPPEADHKGAIALAAAALLGSFLLPAPLRLPLALAAAAPVLRHANDESGGTVLSSHMLEAMAVSISLARRDFTAANTTSFMLALGEQLESTISRRSDDLLKHLLRPSSDQVWVMRDGVEIQLGAGSVTVGDTVVVGTGTVIPVDGTVLSGEATVNEATMTGESVAVVKQRGDAVLSGTLLEDGRLLIYAEQVGARTAQARIAHYVQSALTAKSDAQLEASRLADRLVPSVLGLAGASLVLTGDWRAAASVLQADYSCALKLATPVAFKAAMVQAGRSGILVKGATALERLAQADTVLFDKTGTLTTGMLQVTDSIAFDPTYSADDLICLAASVEEHYFHPLALAVVNAAKATHNHHFDHQDVQFIVAHGVASTIDGQRVVVGSRHFVEEDEGVDLSAHAERIDALYRQGKTLLFIGFGGRPLGVLALEDTLRANAAATIAGLRAAGVKRVMMLTGDHPARAEELAAQLDLDGVHAQLLPDDKARIIGELAAQGARVAFVGDGVNDAPALAGAHVGIAMQRGADIARLTADVALLEDDVARVADAKALANRAMDRIGSTYRVTVGANSAILALAALGLLSPVATAFLHNGTTIAILLSALRPLKPRP